MTSSKSQYQLNPEDFTISKCDNPLNLRVSITFELKPCTMYKYIKYEWIPPCWPRQELKDTLYIHHSGLDIQADFIVLNCSVLSSLLLKERKRLGRKLLGY